MAITLEEAMGQEQQQVDIMPKYMTLSQASDIVTVQDIVKNIPKPKENWGMRFAKGLYNSLDSAWYDTLPAIQLAGKTVDLAIGGYFNQPEEKIDNKKLAVITMQRNLMKAQQERSKYLTPETANSWSYGIGQGAGNLLTMYATGGLAGGIAKGVGLSAVKGTALKTAVGVGSGLALENVEQQTERIPTNEQGEIIEEQITPEWAKKSSVGTASYLAISGLLERYVGFGKQVKMWDTPIKFNNQALKNISAVLKNTGKGFLSEGLTEGLQSLTSSGILLAEGTIKLSDMPERLQQAWKEAVIGGILGGTVGTAVSINQQINVKKMLNKELENVVADPKEREKVVNAIWEAGTNEMSTVISKELELSSELNAKHGSIYDNMSSAILQAMQESGAFVNESETDIAQYVAETSKMFANQVLAEANKRNCYIDEVLKASDIAYFDGKIQLKAGDKVISETPAIVDEDNNKAETLSLSFYKNEILGYKFDKKNLETIKGRYKNKYYTKAIDSLSNGIIRAERDFNIIINEIYRNPAIIENSELMSKLEAQLEKITNSLPEEEEITNAFYENFWGAVNSASEYLNVKNNNKSDAKIYEQSAYHGTPHRFVKFLLDAIGTGEGAQAHGWGLYFAENKDVAEGYRKTLISDNTSVTYNGKTYFIDENFGNVLYRIKNYGKDKAIEFYQDKEQEFREEAKTSQNPDWWNKEADNFKKVVEQIKNIDESKIEENKGQLFEVDIPENDVLLDEDKVISEQPEIIKKAFEFEQNALKEKLSENQVVFKALTNNNDINIKEIYQTNYWNEAFEKFKNNPNNYIDKYYSDSKITGKKLYDDIAHRLGSAKNASKKLNELGIKGITYNGYEDGRCYVIFDDKAVKVLNTFYQIKGLPKQKKPIRGYFNYKEIAIKLTEHADYSTLPHELAHYWLDNMWTYTRTGKASQQYMNNFNGLVEWLGIKKGQIGLTEKQHEKFARGYEKYLMQGYSPNALIQGAFEDYDRWLKRVYETANELDVKLTPQAIDFFDTMTTGELPEYTVEETQKELMAKNLEEAQRTVEETQKVIVEKQAEFTNTPINTSNIVANATPLTSESEQKKSAVYTKQADILGVAEELNYNKVNIEEQNKKATEFVANNLQQAERIVKGLQEPPADILKNAIFNAYLKQMLAMGNNEAYLEALRIQSLNLTRAGQEIASQRGAIENIFDSAFWIRKIETNAKIRVAVNKYGSWGDETGEKAVSKMNDYIEKEINSVLDAYLDATPEEQAIIVEKLSNKITSEFKVKKKKEKAKEENPNIFAQSLKEPTEVRTRTNAYNYLYKVIYGDLGISLTKEQASEVIAKTTQIQKAIETSRDKNGNPSALFFKNLSEMENYANSIQPSPALSVLTSVVGRGNMLFSLKSLALNIESNILNFLSEATIKRVLNKTTNLAVDPEVIKEYMRFSKEVYKTSGYQVSTMPELDPTQNLLSEKMISSQGEGWARALGRFFEQTIFKYGLGYPDVIFKDLAFTDTVNLLATQYANGNSQKATEVFKDAILIEPKTEIGKQIREVAINDALIATYQNKGTISKLALDVRNAFNKFSGDLRLGDILSPFVKTPANVIGIGLDYSVGGIFAVAQAKTIINDFKNGYFSEDTKKAFRSLSRNGLGLFVALILGALIDDDDYIPDYALLTPKQRELVKLKGGVFNSIKWGDKYISLDYLGTLGMPLVGILNAKRGAELKDQVYNYFNGARLQAYKVPVLSDLKELLDQGNRALTQEVDKNIEDFENWAIDFVSSRSIPAIISDVAKITDDYERNTNNKAFNRFMAKIPVIREELPLVYNYGTGRPVETQNAISTLFAGARIKEEITNPVIREIDRLSTLNTDNNVTITKITKTGVLSNLSDEKKLKVERDFAKRYSKEVKTLLQTVQYRRADNETKVKLINKVRSNIREDLKKQYGLKKRGR